jgi:hypothetical protein
MPSKTILTKEIEKVANDLIGYIEIDSGSAKDYVKNCLYVAYCQGKLDGALEMYESTK